jgi:preprotein translocase subunit SecD
VERKWVWKWVFVLLLMALAGVAMLPSFIKKPAEGAADPLPEFIRKSMPGINLGLDLQGGLRLIYEVEVLAAVEDKRDHLGQAIVDALAERAEFKGVKMMPGAEPHAFDLVFPSVEMRDAKEVQDILKEYRESASIFSEEGATLHMALNEPVVDYTRELSVRQAMETVGNRIDELGLANTSVAQRDEDIIVEIPGVDPARVDRIKRIISQTARLEFKMVDAQGSQAFFTSIKDLIVADGPIELQEEQVSDGERGNVKSYFLQAKDQQNGKSGRLLLKEFMARPEVKAKLPADRAVGYEKEQGRDDANNPTPDVVWRTYYLEKTAGVTGEYIDAAAVMDDPSDGRPYVSLSFNQAGAKIFEELTGKNVKRHMAIQLDDVINSAPVINERIGGGNARITMGGYESYQSLYNQAQDLVVVLRAGALPAPLRPLTESTVGPDLGRDSIAKGQWSLMLGFISVVIFMLIYYRFSGLAANMALLVNGVLLVGILSAFGATLTLPGIAGILLTIGMAVDANVIIFERIREELRAGKSPRAAVEAGYKRAFWTVFDAQVTTFIAGVVMLQYGTGAIKGFAVTLLVGIVTSLFTSIFVSRLFLDWATRRSAESLSI